MRAPQMWMHGLISWVKHFADRVIPPATFLGCNLWIIMLTGPQKYKQEDTFMQNEDFASGLSPLTWLQIFCKKRPGGNAYPPNMGALKRQVSSCLWARHSVSFVSLPSAFHMPVEARTQTCHGGGGRGGRGASMCAEAMGFCGLIELCVYYLPSGFNSPLSACWIRHNSCLPKAPMKPWGGCAVSTAVEPTDRTGAVGEQNEAEPWPDVSTPRVYMCSSLPTVCSSNIWWLYPFSRLIRLRS